jgi:pimeloyl-ACP methyl ester carboxylesterase
MTLFSEYAVHGPAGAPVIVLLHGASLSRAMWGPAVAKLSPTFRLAVPDLPGHARRPSPFTLEQAVKDVGALLDQEAPGGAILAGDSLGGYVSLAAAGRFPERVRGVVAAGAAMSFRDARFQSWLMTLPARLLVPLIGERRLLAKTEVAVRKTYPKAPVAAMMADVRIRARNEALADLIRFDVVGAIGQYPGRIHFVNGEQDRQGRRHEARFLAAARQGTLEIMPGLPHGVSLAEPDAFAEIIARFAESLG